MGMKYGDRILYEPTGETGVAGEFLQDGDVEVTWDKPTNTSCMVKWNQCRKHSNPADYPDQLHPSHKTRVSDASSFDEICVNCGATDSTNGGWGRLRYPCPQAPRQEPPVPGDTTHATYTALCDALWSAYLIQAKAQLAMGHDTSKLGQAAQLAFLSCAARIAADIGTPGEALAGQAALCLQEAMKRVPRWG